MATVKKPSQLFRMFFNMAMNAALSRMPLHMTTNHKLPPADPLRKVREQARREANRWGGKGGYGIYQTGIRQGQRIARQIAKGQLKEENGLIRAK